MAHLWDEYCDWLLKEVGFTEGFKGRRVPSGTQRWPWEYDNLMRHLHSIDFRWIIERDENRMKDGLALRYDFYDDFDVDTDVTFRRSCSVLEMLIALAVRIDNEYIGDPGNPHPEYFFWEMIHNLGLDFMDDARFDATEVDEIVDIWMNREFESDGSGSIFHLNNVTFDCRNAEIWSQAMAYLTENY